jgi:hypothetical protein
VDIASLVCYRVLFGALMMWDVWRYTRLHDGPESSWVHEEWIRQPFHFTFLGFDWVKPWPGNWMYVHWVVLGVLAFCIMAGLCYRLCVALFFVGFCHVFLVETANYLNHFYLICLFSFLMIFVPMHRAWSFDAWWRPKLRATTVPAWTLWLLRGQMILAYFYAGVAKLNWDWLQGEPLRHWLPREQGEFYPLIGRHLDQEWAIYLFSYGGLSYDLAVAPLLLWHRTRPWMFALTLFFHFSNKLLFSIGVFPYFSIAASLLFFDPDWPRRVWRGLRGLAARAGLARPAEAPPMSESVAAGMAAATTAGSSFTPGQRRVLWLAGAYFTVQVLMPLRHWLYPGNVSWTEEGHNFAWHMKLRDKKGSALFFVTSKKQDIDVAIDPREYLNERQRRKMATRPDMIHQFALFLADEYRKEGADDVEVRVRANISLNYRKKQPLIDPTVNLAAEPRNLWHKRWIVPLTEPLRRPDPPKPASGKPAPSQEADSGDPE